MVAIPTKAEYGSDVVVDLLRALEIEYVSMNPGATFRGLHDSIVNYGGNRRPELILCCHEEIAVSLAHGYGKAAGKPMAAAVHDIVGLLHASMAVYNAWVDRAPLLLLGATGPMAVEKRRPWIDWIHTALVQGNVVRDYVKWDDQPTSLLGIVEAVLRGWQLACMEPRGPVYICLDAALQEERLNGAPPLPDLRRFDPPSPVQADPVALRRAAELLVLAERPVVIADYLGRNPKSVEALVQLAELLALPVLDNGNLFSFPNTHPLDLTGAEEELLAEADVILSLDVFDLFQSLTTVDRITRQAKYLIPETAKIIDLSLRHFAIRSWAQDYGRLQGVDVNIAASTALAIPALVEQCRAVLARHPERQEAIQRRYRKLKDRHDALRKMWQQEAQGQWNLRPVSMARLAAELWEVVKDEDWVLVNRDIGRANWARRLWRWDVPYRYLGSSMGGGLGVGIGHSMGAALAHKPFERLCIDIQPDGDLLYTASGLWTAAHHRIPLLVVMLNNRSYYNDEVHQEVVARMRGRSVENKIIGIRIDDPPVDFAQLARAFGLQAWGPIDDPEKLRPALEQAVRYVKEQRRCALVDVVTQPM